MNKIILTIVFILASSLSFSQSGVCGPTGLGLENNRVHIIDGKELTAPFNGIIHLRVKRLFRAPKLSTASFIKKDLIITANHNVMNSPFITKIEVFVNGKWIKLKKKHLRIYHYHQGLFHNRNKDIAIIKIKDLTPLEGLDITTFKVKSYEHITAHEEKDFHLTGFPSDTPNTLVDKSGSSTEFILESSKKIVGYNNLYTCEGDSGAPLWFKEDNTFYVCGIHHGKKRIDTYNNKILNAAILITPTIEKWILKKYNQ